MEYLKEKQRSSQQNRAMHLWFTQVAKALNEAGLDMRKTLKPKVWETISIPWTKQSVKEYLWRPVQQAMLIKESTTELSVSDIDKVFDVLNLHLGEKLGIHKPFPSLETILDELEKHGKHP